jgi:hypothetical protein
MESKEELNGTACAVPKPFNCSLTPADHIGLPSGRREQCDALCALPQAAAWHRKFQHAGTPKLRRFQIGSGPPVHLDHSPRYNDPSKFGGQYTGMDHEVSPVSL